MELNLKRNLIVFDLETTGLAIGKDRIVEIGALIVKPDGTTETIQQYLNPEIEIPKEASDVHGITNQMVEEQPTFGAIAESLYRIFKDCDLAGYNSNKFDIPFLVAEFKRVGIDFDVSNVALIDACYIFRTREKRDLTNAYAFYCNKKLENSHSAVADLEATWEVLKKQCEFYDDLKFDVNVLHEASKDEKTIDIDGKLVLDKDGFPCINFGKHKGKRIADITIEAPDYFDWMLKQDFTDNTKNTLRAILKELAR